MKTAKAAPSLIVGNKMKMKWTLAILFLGALTGCLDDYSRAMLELETASNEKERFYALGESAKESFNQGKLDDAKRFATEQLELAPEFKGNWNYGNAIHSSHVVLGRIALAQGNKGEAVDHLFLAADTPGSPQLNSFGPNLSLAHDLLREGESEVVIKYLELTIRFWANEDNSVHKRNLKKIRYWQEQIRNGQIPDFGANMVY
mgnify:CR=1 FL=1